MDEKKRGKNKKNKYQKILLSKLRSDDNEMMKESFGLKQIVI